MVRPVTPGSSKQLALAATEDILNRWHRGESQATIAAAIGIPDARAVSRVVVVARKNNDERARRYGGTTKKAPTLATVSIPHEETEVLHFGGGGSTSIAPVKVSLARVDFGNTPDVFRPIAASIDRERYRETSRTAHLMGDPSPERSALKRPLRPEEWASRGGEGRFTTAFHSGGQTKLYRAGRQGFDQ